MYQRIMVPIDGSATSSQALATAIRMAQAFGARLRLIHLLEETSLIGAYDQFADYTGELMRLVRENANRVLADGAAAVKAAGLEADEVLLDNFAERLGDAVAQAARQWAAELIVVGTHGRRGIGRVLMGSGAEQIVRVAPCPVLVVRSPNDATAAIAPPAAVPG